MVFKRVTKRKDSGIFCLYLGCCMSQFAWYSPDLCLCSSIIINSILFPLKSALFGCNTLYGDLTNTRDNVNIQMTVVFQNNHLKRPNKYLFQRCCIDSDIFRIILLKSLAGLVYEIFTRAIQFLLIPSHSAFSSHCLTLFFTLLRRSNPVTHTKVIHYGHWT